MKKIYCDATGKEIIKGNYKILDIPVHIIEIYENGISSYVDSEGNAICGKIKKLELNQESYNRIMLIAYKEFKKIQEENNIEEIIKPIKDNFISYNPFDYSNPKINPTIIAMYGVTPNPSVIYGVNVMKYGIQFKNKNISNIDDKNEENEDE